MKSTKPRKDPSVVFLEPVCEACDGQNLDEITGRTWSKSDIWSGQGCDNCGAPVTATRYVNFALFTEPDPAALANWRVMVRNFLKDAIG